MKISSILLICLCSIAEAEDKRAEQDRIHREIADRFKAEPVEIKYSVIQDLNVGSIVSGEMISPSSGGPLSRPICIVHDELILPMGKLVIYPAGTCEVASPERSSAIERFDQKVPWHIIFQRFVDEVQPFSDGSSMLVFATSPQRAGQLRASPIRMRVKRPLLKVRTKSGDTYDPVIEALITDNSVVIYYSKNKEVRLPLDSVVSEDLEVLRKYGLVWLTGNQAVETLRKEFPERR